MQRLNVILQIAGVNQEVDVASEAAHVDISADDNTSSVTLDAKALDALSDDPDELEADLLALAGPSVGPNGGQIYVDGFTVDDGLPPKNAIREVRVNQNPFSAEYDKLGYGRVEIITKPGSNSTHGRVTVSGNDKVLDTNDPFAVGDPSYYSFLSMADVSGPIGKKASYFLTYQHRNISNDAIVHGYQLDPNNSNNSIALDQTLSSPNTLDVVSPRIDYAINANNFLNFSYQFNYQNQKNLGIGGFATSDQGYSLHTLQNQIRANDTQMIGTHLVNQASLQLQDQLYVEHPLASGPEILVPASFSMGGNQDGALNYHHHHMEINELLTYTHGQHTFGFGGRLRTVTEPYVSPFNFNGTFKFSSLLTTPSVQQSYQAQAPQQFSITVGNPLTRIYSWDVGVFMTDDWRLAQKVMLSYGVRYETQNYIHDWKDWEPRLAIAWGIGRKSNTAPKTVLRTGFGIFYDRFSQQLQLEAEALNGIKTTEYIIQAPNQNPDPALNGLYQYYLANNHTVPKDPATLIADGAVTTVYSVQPELHAPYTLQSAIGIERQVSNAITVSETYLNSRGIHQLLTDNINAPEVGDDPVGPNSGARPIPGSGNIYQYVAAGIFNQNQLITNFNIRAGRTISLFGFYSYSHVNSDTGGAPTFPSNPFNIGADYGRAAFDIHHRASVGGTINLKYGVVLNPLLNFQSGAPFNITIPDDLLGSTQSNQRPSFATSSTPAADVYQSPLGPLNIDPGPSEKRIPINYGSGPNNFVLNLRASKTFALGKMTSEHAATGGGDISAGSGGFGSKRVGSAEQSTGGGNLGSRGLGGSGSGSAAASLARRYSLTVTAEARNLLNDVNLAPPNGKLSSPSFLKSNATTGGVYSFAGTNRRIDLQVSFAF